MNTLYTNELDNLDEMEKILKHITYQTDLEEIENRHTETDL